ncbi:10 kDa chaperonin 2, chloroplastic-like [Mangifera indica]|uniref:10 kDa chaperonin 2, chloroplastic-like n=1 Tax=Mangifera indica TaxID=29780 RepID=UPI001CFB0D5A|nr:10 kDa chaperonin 2, chloroplastic-like [Mangifera indica]
MASTFVALSSPLLSFNKKGIPSPSNQRMLGSPTHSMSAISKKLELTKVVAQADRVLICLEQLPEKSGGGVLRTKAAVRYERCLMAEILSVGFDIG